MPRIKSKPRWVPDATWSDYQDRVRYHKFIDSLGGDRKHFEVLEVFEKLLNHPDCKCVWDVVHATADSEKSGQMLLALHWALVGPIKDGLISNEKRKDLFNDLTKASRSLRNAIRALQRSANIPDEILDATSSRVLASVETHTSPGLFPDFNRAQTQLYNMGIELATRDLLFGNDKTSLLIALENGASAWAKKKSLEHRDEAGQTARRRYFALVMVTFFTRHYGKPHHPQVAALSNALLDLNQDHHEIGRLVNSKTAKKYELPSIFRKFEPEFEND